MAFGKKIFKGKMTGHRLYAYGGSRRSLKNFRKKFGITSKNKWVRALKRSLKSSSSSPVSSIAPTTASDNSFKYQGKTLSQLTGGV